MSGILHSEWKRLAKILLSVICAHMADFPRSGHIFIMIPKSLILSFNLMSIPKYICDWICKIRL